MFLADLQPPSARMAQHTALWMGGAVLCSDFFPSGFYALHKGDKSADSAGVLGRQEWRKGRVQHSVHHILHRVSLFYFALSTLW